jgi:cobaltochelatase CobS
MTATATAADNKIECAICGARVHAIQTHLRDEHPEVSVSDYTARFPEAPLLSESARRLIEERQRAQVAEPLKVEMAGASVVPIHKAGVSKQALHEVFKLGKVKAALNARGDGIPITVFDRGGEFDDHVPDHDPAYIFNINLLKTVMLGVELNMPVYLWGHAGVGKTTIIEQICAHTGRPWIRVQHTGNTEESHILGQWTVKNGETVFELGPLPLAMINGWMYVADEYDFAFPSVTAVYQSVLEGKPLIIKEAPKELRIIRPHANFRFVGTGNTNGSGDETGLYQGTNLQNAANYERFAIVERVEYMPKAQEEAILVNQTGIVKEDAKKLVDFATQIRDAYDSKKITMTISPRTLIYAAKLGMARNDFKVGLHQSFINRLTSVDRETASAVAQRIFG